MNQHLKFQLALDPVAKPRIAVVRSLPGLGDLLCCIPALRALRSALPQAHLAFIGLPIAIQMGQRFADYVDTWLEFPGFPGIPEVPLQPSRISEFLTQVHAFEFDLVLQMHGNGSCMNFFALLLGARVQAGFCPTTGYCPDPEWFLPYPETESEIWRHLRLLEFLGIPLQGTHLEFPLSQQDWQEWEAIATIHQLSANYVCIHPGASAAERRWQPQHFAAIADRLAADGMQIVLTGTAAEASLVQTVAALMQYPAINLAGGTRLGALAVLLKQSRLLICNDTGVSHLAAALQVKSVVIFCNSDLQRWAPLNRQLHRVVQIDHEMRSPLSQSASEARLITSVLAEAADLLAQEFAYAS